MVKEFRNYVTRDVHHFMNLLADKGQVVNLTPVNDNAINDNDLMVAGVIPPKAVA